MSAITLRWWCFFAICLRSAPSAALYYHAFISPAAIIAYYYAATFSLPSLATRYFSRFSRSTMMLFCSFRLFRRCRVAADFVLFFAADIICCSSICCFFALVLNMLRVLCRALCCLLLIYVYVERSAFEPRHMLLSAAFTYDASRFAIRYFMMPDARCCRLLMLWLLFHHTICFSARYAARLHCLRLAPCEHCFDVECYVYYLRYRYILRVLLPDCFMLRSSPPFAITLFMPLFYDAASADAPPLLLLLRCWFSMPSSWYYLRHSFDIRFPLPGFAIDIFPACLLRHSSIISLLIRSFCCWCFAVLLRYCCDADVFSMAFSPRALSCHTDAMPTIRRFPSLFATCDCFRHVFFFATLALPFAFYAYVAQIYVDSPFMFASVMTPAIHKRLWCYAHATRWKRCYAAMRAAADGFARVYWRVLLRAKDYYMMR